MDGPEIEWFRVCAFCGEVLPIGSRHPVHTDRAPDGLRLRAFCDEQCNSGWLRRAE